MKTYSILSSGHTFTLQDPEVVRVAGSRPFAAFTKVHDAVNALSLARASINADTHLSEEGKRIRIYPENARAWLDFVAGLAAVAEAREATAAREAALYAVPKLDPSAAAVAVEDREARDWWRSLPLDERARVMREFADDPAAGAKYARLQVAILRSPIPLPDRETAWFLETWKAEKRLSNPGESIAIGAEKDAANWSQRGLGHLQGILADLTGWGRKDLLTWAVQPDKRHDSAAALGFAAIETEQARRIAAQRRVSATV